MRIIFCFFCLFFFLARSYPVLSEDLPPIPFKSDGIHLGVASCAGSSCHGSIQPWADSTILQTEYIIWEEQDPHSQAYKVLLTKESQKIASNLGLGKPESEPLCLDCHADNVSLDQRSDTFQITDGVGCEACHGAAETWLDQHISGASDHKSNLRAGLYPTEDPLARARLCLSCHFGTKDRFVTHRIMGAGHPRMSFELDTYTLTQPAHVAFDEDYRLRKTYSSSAKVWAVGQVVAVESLIDAMVDPERNKDGIFPEFVLFDCHSCHHPMSDKRWVPRETHGISPGVPRIFDANLIMIGIILDRIDPVLSKEIKAKTRVLHQSYLSGDNLVARAANDLNILVKKVVKLVVNHNFTIEDMQKIMLVIIDRGLGGAFLDYSSAEQAAMGLSAILQAMADDQVFNRKQYLELNNVLSLAFDAVENDEDFRAVRFISALKAFEASL